MSGAWTGVTWMLAFNWGYWLDHLYVSSPCGVSLPKKEHSGSKCATRTRWKLYNFFWISLTSHIACVPLCSIGYSSVQLRFKRNMVRPHSKRAGGMGATITALLEKYSQPQDDQSMAVSSWDSYLGSLKWKCWEKNRGPRGAIFGKIPSFNQHTNYYVSWPSEPYVI